MHSLERITEKFCLSELCPGKFLSVLQCITGVYTNSTVEINARALLVGTSADTLPRRSHALRECCCRRNDNTAARSRSLRLGVRATLSRDAVR